MIDKNTFISKKEDEFFKSVIDNLFFEDEMKAYYINFFEKKTIPDLLGKTVKISENQFRNVHNIIKNICTTLEMEMVDAFVYEDFYYGVESKGINKCWIEISAKTISDFSEEQLKFIIGRELYNIKFKNTYYTSLIKLGLQNLNLLKMPGAGISAESLKCAVYKWSRAVSLSCDNFGYCVCGNLKESIQAVLLTILNNKTLTQNINITEYIKQADEITALDDEVYNNTKLDEIVPYGPYRVKNLISYASSVRAKEGKIRILGLN